MKLLARQGEGLEEHSVQVAEICKSLARGLGIREEREAYLAGLLHDLGKAVPEAQERIRGGRGTPGHELISALVARQVLEALNFERGERVILPILRHHQAIEKLEDRLRRLGEWYRGGQLPKLQFLDSALGVKVSDNLEVPPREKLHEQIRALSRRYIGTQFKDWVRARVLTGILMAADTYVASKKDEKPSGYRKAVRKLVETYSDVT